MGRGTQTAVEKERGEREFALAKRREWHELEAEKRAARGIAAALKTDLQYKRVALDAADTSGVWWPHGTEMEIELPREEQLAIAAWIGDPAWGVIIAPFLMLANADLAREQALSAGTPYVPGSFDSTKASIDMAVGALTNEIDVTLRAMPPIDGDAHVVA